MKNRSIRLISMISALLTFCANVSTKLQAENAAQGDQKRIPIVIDTDMGFDDWMAVLYLLNKPELEIIAITVDGAGETHCPQGAINVTKLLTLAGKKEIPVYYGNQPPATLPFQFPKVIRDSATAMQVPGFTAIPATSNYSDAAATRLLQLAIQAGKSEAPLTILSIGTSTNLAQAIRKAKADGSSAAFAKGIKMIYKGGGAVGDEVDGALTNKNLTGNLNIPDIFPSKNKTAEWNIYANASATETLLESGLPVTLVPTNLSDQVKITKQSYEALKKIAKTQPAKFVVSEIEDTVSSQGGWEKAELEYWDPSVVVAAVNPGFVTKKFSDVRICVDSAQGDFHGTVFINTTEGTTTKCQALGAKPGSVSVYTAIDTDAFYRDFFSTLNRD